MANRWFQHTLRRRELRPQNQAVAVATIGVVIALILGALYLSQVVSFATTNRQIEDLQTERDALELANEQLRAEIAGLRTVPILLARAQELGFRPALESDIEYLFVEGYNPDRGETVAPIREEEIEEVVLYDETFGGWLQQQFDSLRNQLEDFGRGTEE